MTGFRRTGEEVVHQGHLWRVVVADYEAPDGSTFRRDVVRSPGAVGVVPVAFDPEGTPFVTLVRQFRPTIEVELVEIPAGMRDVPGEPPEETAHRELAEEVGLAADHLELLVELLPSPGMSDGATIVYLATGLRPVDRAAHGPEEEHAAVLQVSLDEAISQVERGDLTDAKTIIGLLLAARRLGTGDLEGGRSTR